MTANKTPYGILVERAREYRDSLGVFCPGGAVMSLDDARDVGYRLFFFDYDDGPFEGRVVLGVAPDGSMIRLEQFYHGGPASGDWWWVFRSV